ncbi:MAG: hypothetical protein IJO81_06035 [Clostridia bacterium]|nr:hypothetical protein [Clostridia bacterium]
MKLQLILDRIEEGRFALLTDSEGNSYETSASLLPCHSKEGDAFYGEIDEDGIIISLTPRENPDAGKNAARLRRLFDKFKN